MLAFLGQAVAAGSDSLAVNLGNADFWTGILAVVKEKGPGLGLKLLGAIAIFLIGRFIADKVRKGLAALMKRRNSDPSLIGFTCSLAYFAVLAFAIVAVIGQFGVETASFIAILGAAGFALGMALQGTLSHFASGVMILMFRPFKVGDFIDAGGVSGVVKEIQIFSTTIATPDNIRITVPNGAVFGGTIRNFNGYETRRVDMVMGIGYDDDINQAMTTITELLKSDNRVLTDPAPMVAVKELGDSSVNIAVRPWVKTADYWSVYFDFQKACKEAFDTAGIEIPYPQSVIHMRNAKA